MKKLIVILLATILLLSSFASLTACNDSNENTVVRLNEVTHSIFYAPLYVAINLGYFEEEGLEIELTNGGGSDKVMTALMSGSADVGLLGPETAVYVKTGGSSNYPKVFGQLTQKDGSFLISRVKEDDFKWSNLTGKEIIGGRYGGMPAMSLEYALKKNAGLWDTVDVNYDVQFDLITASFESGTGDYCTMFEPNASQYEALGKGYIVASVGEEADNMPYTCFMATQKYINGNKDVVTRFMKAIIKGINYVTDNNYKEVSAALIDSFPSTDEQLIEKAVKSYKDIGAYKTTPVMSEEEFDNLLNVLLEAGTITSKVNYADLIDNSIALSLIA